eukprot:jgi/Mesvir1/3781/Mv08188-RA.1
MTKSPEETEQAALEVAETSDRAEMAPTNRFYRMLPLKVRDYIESDIFKICCCTAGIVGCLMCYGVLQERIMTRPYGTEGAMFKYSLFLVLCNRLFTCAVALSVLVARRGSVKPVAPVYKYAAVSLSNVAATYCQYEALKYVSFPVQTLAKCAKMIPVMVWGTLIMRKKYGPKDYIVAVIITLGCTIFLLTGETKSRVSAHDVSVWSGVFGIMLMGGYLGFDGFTSTFQDKLFKGYDMEVFNQILYVTLCSSFISLGFLISAGQLGDAIKFVMEYPECLNSVMLLSAAATLGQMFISYTIRTYGALVFATIMTTRQFLSILLSCILFGHPLSIGQWFGTGLVFGPLYYKTLASRKGHSKDKESAKDKAPGVEDGKDVEGADETSKLLAPPSPTRKD